MAVEIIQKLPSYLLGPAYFLNNKTVTKTSSQHSVQYTVK